MNGCGPVFRSKWGLGETIASCEGCDDDLSLLFDNLREAYPEDRMALLSSMQDAVVRAYFFLTGPEYRTALLRLRTTRLGDFGTYFVPGNTHTMLRDLDSFAVGDVPLSSWLTEMVTDSPDWISVGP